MKNIPFVAHEVNICLVSFSNNINPLSIIRGEERGGMEVKAMSA